MAAAAVGIPKSRVVGEVVRRCWTRRAGGRRRRRLLRPRGWMKRLLVVVKLVVVRRSRMVGVRIDLSIVR